MKYRLIPGGYVDETGPHRGVPPTQEDFQRIALLTMHRKLFAEGKIEFKPFDPLLQSDLPTEVEFTQELPIEEVKKRYPDAEIPEEKK
jgi:hypothetical protein